MTLAGDLDARPSAVGDAPPSRSFSATLAEKRELLRGLRVLFVDDQEDVRRLVALVLRRFGATVETAASVDDALTSLTGRLPDVLVSDIQMPHASGIDLIRSVRETAPSPLRNLPAAALSAHCRDEDRAGALDAGFHEYMTKPVDPGVLAETVARLARRSRPTAC